jgi:hypothetical protein
MSLQLEQAPFGQRFSQEYAMKVIGLVEGAGQRLGVPNVEIVIPETNERIG